MRTQEELFRIAQRQVAERRQRAVSLAEQRHADARAAHPELAAAEAEKTRCGSQIVRAACGGSETMRAQAQAEFETAAAKLSATMAALGLPADAFVPEYRCPVCKDTGLAGGRTCGCVAELARTLRREEINAASPLALCGFETFDVTRYPAEPDPELGMNVRDYMTKVLEFSRKYAENFGSGSSNLLFLGSAGLGKTHLALAIADAVLNKGFDVLYTSAAGLSTALEKEHFDWEAGDELLTACQQADLLILDDIGTEYITKYTISALYELVNARMLARRPTIYTTNITDSAVFEARYTEKVASRILSGGKQLKFFGEDQRIKSNRTKKKKQA